VAGVVATSSGSSGSGSSGSTGPTVGGTSRSDVLNPAGQVLSETVIDDATGAVLYSVSNTYDPAGDKLTTTDGDGRTTAWTYNDQGEVASETIAFGTPQAATTDYSYDDSGNLIEVEDPDGNKTLYTYNTQNEETSMTDPLGHTEYMTYKTRPSWRR
jgi:YD repeat-containing protein